MECPVCYDEETSESSLKLYSKKSYLPMAEIGYYRGYNYYQCNRCLLTRKQESGRSTGMIENVSTEELKSVSKNFGKISLVSGVLAVTLIGAGILLGGKRK